MREPVQELIGLYQNNIYAAAFSICKNAQDAEDVVQETFIQYHMSKNQFESQQHIRAWLIRVAINKAKNVNHTFWRKNKVPLEEYMETLAFETPKSQNLFETVMKLPEKYRTAIHLFYYEDYGVKEIAGILRISESNVKTRLSRGRKLLKESLQEEWDHDE
ncbi:RNA polymerase sigma factor [Roseburia sp. 1XD42-69]|jgi:RNA polymerase sigma factor, sigma-70 family|uniref:RNA polymerase sigma factor n=1 Tax=Roseburia sp. 1XD42-69 TaxID=2320088 RepID=UPI000EA13847|nr:RNA polymerase sigma factor [Roseburia sp. 1XD42-69]MCX4320311.1 RNA polymerase sigma factor [Lachnospiraceae bacterium]RKJ68701.1 RNA polymerase sigma factor [Roseburia sp. 1XD42-69]